MDTYNAMEPDRSVTVCVVVFSAGSEALTRTLSVLLESSMATNNTAIGKTC